MLQATHFNAPAFLASALVNGDLSSLTSPDDLRILRRVLAYVRWQFGRGASVVSCEGEPWFARDYLGDVPGPALASLGGKPLGGDVAEYVVVHRVPLSD